MGWGGGVGGLLKQCRSSKSVCRSSMRSGRWAVAESWAVKKLPPLFCNLQMNEDTVALGKQQVEMAKCTRRPADVSIRHVPLLHFPVKGLFILRGTFPYQVVRTFHHLYQTPLSLSEVYLVNTSSKVISEWTENVPKFTFAVAILLEVFIVSFRLNMNSQL